MGVVWDKIKIKNIAKVATILTCVAIMLQVRLSI